MIIELLFSALIGVGILCTLFLFIAAISYVLELGFKYPLFGFVALGSILGIILNFIGVI